MNKKLLSIVMGLLIPTAVFAQEKSNPLDINLTVDFAYHPHADFIAGGNHYAPLTGFYESLEGRIIGDVNYKINTPLGDHWLLNGAYVNLQGNAELTPVSIKPGVHVDFSPLPFLVFSAGAQAGTGWDLMGIIGAGEWNGYDKYTAFKPFESWLLKWYAQGVFQFDTGAIWKGDWNHFQIMYTYQVYYEGLSNVANGDIWMWQATKNKANGICNYQSLILAYQMPMVLSRVGVMFELEGYYSASDYGKYTGYKGDFKALSINPLCQFSFGAKDNLTIMATFKTRQSFKEAHENGYVEPLLTYDGYEWFFNRVVIRYQHKF